MSPSPQVKTLRGHESDITDAAIIGDSRVNWENPKPPLVISLSSNPVLGLGIGLRLGVSVPETTSDQGSVKAWDVLQVNSGCCRNIETSLKASFLKWGREGDGRKGRAGGKRGGAGKGGAGKRGGCRAWGARGSLEPRPSSLRFYLAALEKNLTDFSPRLRDKIWARKAWV